ncbi:MULTISPECIES: LacI family DNA-binding transcriptional regulator [unclassified Paenibacillus]|uniref:LacI family DNA-binding transcriptional regulator n=1 Tax=unclassified Paenibacillus TaxID=185978 RepID=UPI001C10A851|nr:MULTISPECIES: LacI family DNA-binding transcriptional regulator [unclassified Paenibacillus]MBU5444401.1 LacI family transcriptional regulator [Paenibacillus sp. MSJ-34]CAH0120172.1 Catabolite control protein A [Paenibacillus sp. CECT 9249]
MNITIADLARITGLAKSTVSGVLNNKAGFSEKTRAKVLEAAEKHGYVPNEIARGLTSKFTKTIGLVIKDITNPFYNRITKGVQDVANEHGYTVFLCSSGENHMVEVAQMNAMVGKRVDGLIIAPLLEGVTFDHIYELKRKEIPFATLGEIPGLTCDYVEFDDYQGSVQVTNHLIEYGHAKIGFVTGQRTSRASKQRFQGFKDTLFERGLTLSERHVFHEAKHLADGVDVGNRLIAMEDRPTALICFDDVIAMGVIKAFEAAGLSIPGDLSLIGFDDIELMTFPLTSVSIPTYEAGKLLAKILFERIFEENVSEYKQITLSEQLVVRSSVKRM